MKISMVASGSRGDVQPYIALGQGLKYAGYTVRVLTSDDFETLVTDAGLAFGSMGQSIETPLQSDAWRKVTESGNFVAILGKMRGAMQDGAAKLARQMPGLLAGSDLIVTGMPGLTGQ